LVLIIEQINSEVSTINSNLSLVMKVFISKSLIMSGVEEVPISAVDPCYLVYRLSKRIEGQNQSFISERTLERR